MIDTVTIAGALVPAGATLATVTATHGRAQVGDGPAAGTCTLVIEYPPGSLPTWAGGDPLTLSGPDGPVFTGRVSERSLQHVDGEDGPFGQITVTGMGPVARLGVRQVGDQPWPAETGSQRASRILTAAGLPHAVDGDVDAVVLPRDVDATTAADLLGELVTSTAAAVFDTPDGVIVYQALSGRARPVFPFRWRDFAPDFRWRDFDPALTWNGAPPSIGQWTSPASVFPVELPASVIEFEPRWEATEAAVINHVRVGWGAVPEGGQQAYVELADQGSIDRHGRRYLYVATQLAAEADALAYASRIITTQARDRWGLTEITVVLDQLTPQLRAAVLGLRCGDHITVRDLPQPAPALHWTGICEGWTYTQWGDALGVHAQITLRASDPLHSLAVMRWSDFPGHYRWRDFPAYLTWADLTTTDRLEAA